MDRVGIVGWFQMKPSMDIPYGRYDLIFETVRGALDSVGLKRKDVTTVVSATNDFYDGRTISNCFTVECGGAYMKDETKVEMDGAYAALYGAMRVLSGNHKLAVVWGGSMAGSCYPYSCTTLLATDPTFERQLEYINDITVGAFQMRAYMEKYKLSAEDIANVAAKNHKNAAKNPLALPESQKADCTPADVLKADMLSSPMTSMMYATPCDGMACILLAPEKQALKIRDDPVWITSVGYNQETYYLGERDLSQSLSMQNAAKMAYGGAGIKDPKKDFQVAEIFENYAAEEAIIAEALGLCDKGKGTAPGSVAINPSGGAISGNAPCATGLVRIIEACKQINGKAEGHQVKGVTRALATGQTGMCGQNSIVYVLEGGKK